MLGPDILACLASAVFAIITFEIVAMPIFDTGQGRADPLRLVEAITAGLAFRATGTILLRDGKLRGLTTGAALWLAGATGLSAGPGLWLIAVVTCLPGRPGAGAGATSGD